MIRVEKPNAKETASSSKRKNNVVKSAKKITIFKTSNANTCLNTAFSGQWSQHPRDAKTQQQKVYAHKNTACQKRGWIY